MRFRSTLITSICIGLDEVLLPVYLVLRACSPSPLCSGSVPAESVSAPEPLAALCIAEELSATPREKEKILKIGQDFEGCGL